MKQAKPQLLPLTGMRFFLAFWVVLFHGFSPIGGFLSAVTVPDPLSRLFNTGYMAVGMFFVLSGFVLAYNYPLERTWSKNDVKRFAVARFARIYPAYCIGLALSAPWVAAALIKHLSPAAVWAESGKAALTWSLLQAWLPQTATAWNTPAWSLSVEAFFYLCFPAIGVALWNLSRPKALVWAAFALWAAALVPPLVAAVVPLSDSGGLPGAVWDRSSAGNWVNFVKFHPLLHIPQFCMGVVAAKAYQMIIRKTPAFVNRGYWTYLPALSVELVAVVLLQPRFYIFLHNGLLLPVHATLILGFALGGGAISRILSTRALVLFGDASYSIYLFHGVIKDWVSLISKRLLHTELAGLAVFAVYSVFLIVFSTAVFVMIEGPARRLLRRKLTPAADNPEAAHAEIVGAAC